MGATSRQLFQGTDDFLLLTRISQSPPWRNRGSVMDAWHQIAQALNDDAACTLTTLNAAGSRARFFRLVAQRRARQDKMLRRGVTDARQYEHKLQLLDSLIARMDAFDEETSLHNLLREVDEDADVESSGHALPLPAPTLVHVPQPQPSQQQQPQAQPKVSMSQSVHHNKPRQQQQQPQQGSMVMPRPHQAQAPVHQPPVSATSGNLAGKSTSRAVTIPLPSQRQTQQLRAVMQRTPAPTASVIPVDSPEFNRSLVGTRSRPADEEPPAKKKKQAAGPTHTATTLSRFPGGGSEGLERIVDRALEFLQRKLELDQEAAEQDRVWRREEAKARRHEMLTVREQTDRLIHAVLELAKSK